MKGRFRFYMALIIYLMIFQHISSLKLRITKLVTRFLPRYDYSTIHFRWLFLMITKISTKQRNLFIHDQSPRSAIIITRRVYGLIFPFVLIQPTPRLCERLRSCLRRDDPRKNLLMWQERFTINSRMTHV